MAMSGAEDGCKCNSSSSAKDEGPVMLMMSKRLRALKKKYNKILLIEQGREQGKAINKEQEEVLKSKMQVVALIEEYERLRQPLAASLSEELAEKEKAWQAASKELEQVSTEDKETLASNGSSMEGNQNAEQGTGSWQTGSLSDICVPTESESEAIHAEGNGEKTSPSLGSSQQSEALDDNLGDLIQMLYFAVLFDVRHGDMKEAWTKFHERSSCLSYDYVADDDPTPPLGEADLDALAKFGSLIVSRPPNAPLSHKDALQNCVSHARLWLLGSDTLIDGELNMTYTNLRARFNRILSSEYFTMTPELKPYLEAKPVSSEFEVHNNVGGSEEHAEDIRNEVPSEPPTKLEKAPETEPLPVTDGDGGNHENRHQQQQQQVFQRQRGPYRERPRGSYGRTGNRGGYRGRGNRGGNPSGGRPGQYYEQQQQAYYQQKPIYVNAGGSGNGNAGGGGNVNAGGGGNGGGGNGSGGRRGSGNRGGGRAQYTSVPLPPAAAA